MIIVAALLIMREAYKGVLAPRVLDAPLQGLLVNGPPVWSTAYGAGLSSPRAPSPFACPGGGRPPPAVRRCFFHRRDIWRVPRHRNGLVHARSGPRRLVALNILWSGWKVMKTSLSGLLDERCRTRSLPKSEASFLQKPWAPLRPMTSVPAMPARQPLSISIWWCPATRPSPMPTKSATGSRSAQGQGAGRNRNHSRRAGEQGEAYRRRRGLMASI